MPLQCQIHESWIYAPGKYSVEGRSLRPRRSVKAQESVSISVPKKAGAQKCSIHWQQKPCRRERVKKKSSLSSTKHSQQSQGDKVLVGFFFRNCQGKMLCIPIQVGDFAQPALRVFCPGQWQWSIDR